MAANLCARASVAGVLLLAAGQVNAQQTRVPRMPQPCEQTVVVLKANDTPDDFSHPGPNYNIFNASQPDDQAIYYSAGDWVRDADSLLFLDGVVDSVGSFGMVLGNFGFDYPEGHDRQVKHIQEYTLAPAYAAGMTARTLRSATLTIVVDRVVDMSLSGCTDCVASEWMYINAFAGDGLLTTVADAQRDFVRSDRLFPETWDLVVHLVSPDGFRLSDDEIDFFGGTITFEIDVTAQVRALLANGEAFAGFTMSGSHDGDFTLMSLDGGSYPVTQLPTLTLAGLCPAYGGTLAPAPASPRHQAAMPATTIVSYPELGDLNRDGHVGPEDLAHFVDCYIAQLRDGHASGCTGADLNRDGVVDTDDLVLIGGLFVK